MKGLAGATAGAIGVELQDALRSVPHADDAAGRPLHQRIARLLRHRLQPPGGAFRGQQNRVAFAANLKGVVDVLEAELAIQTVRGWFCSDRNGDAVEFHDAGIARPGAAESKLNLFALIVAGEIGGLRGEREAENE